MIRALFVILFLICFFIIGIIPFIIIYWVYYNNPKKKTRIYQSAVQWAFRVVLFIAGTEVEVSGVENIPRDTAVLFMGNHRGYFDIVASYIHIPILTGFISKTEMEHLPILSSWMRGIGCLFLERKDPKKGLKTINQGADMLKNGHSLFIFPEGTRGYTDQLADFKQGSTKLATKAGVPIVPVAIHNTDAVLEQNGFRLLRPAKVKIQFGEPVMWQDFDRKEVKQLGAHVQAIIQKMLVE